MMPAQAQQIHCIEWMATVPEHATNDLKTWPRRARVASQAAHDRMLPQLAARLGAVERVEEVVAANDRGDGPEIINRFSLYRCWKYRAQAPG